MGTRALEQGEVGRRVAAAIKRMRTERRWTLKEVSDALGEVGRPLLPSGVSKIEEGQRRVDVDDLVAFCKVFRVQPDALLGQYVFAASVVGSGGIGSATVQVADRDEARARDAVTALNPIQASAAMRAMAEASASFAEVAKTFTPLLEFFSQASEGLSEDLATLKRHGFLRDDDEAPGPP